MAAIDPAGATIAAQLAERRIALLLFAALAALLWWLGLGTVFVTTPGIWLALVIGIDGSLLIAQLVGALAAFAGFRALRDKPWPQRWVLLILLASVGTGLSLW